MNKKKKTRDRDTNHRWGAGGAKNKTYNDVREAGDEISKSFDHLVPVLGRLEVLARLPVALLYPLDPKAQRGCRRNRLSPNHVPARKNQNQIPRPSFRLRAPFFVLYNTLGHWLVTFKYDNVQVKTLRFKILNKSTNDLHFFSGVDI